MTRYGDPRRTDKSKLARGQMTPALVKDPNARRFVESVRQNIDYLLRKAARLRVDPEAEKNPRKYPLQDVSKLVKPKNQQKQLYPQCVLTAASWSDPTTGSFAGIVGPNGNATSYYFQYVGVAYNQSALTYPMPDFSLATKTATFSAGDGLGVVSVASIVAGLDVPKHYYVQIVAWNSVGKSFSNIMQFNTGLKPEIVTNAATSIKAASAVFTGTVDANSLSTVYHVEWGPDPDCRNSMAEQNIGSGSDPVAFSASFTGLYENTRYYYRVVATNAVGTTTSDTKQFLTPFEEAVGPVPTCTIDPASDIYADNAYLYGTVNPNGYATEYWFEWGLTTAYGNASTHQDAGSGTDASAFDLTLYNLLPETTYHARLVALNEWGYGYSEDITFTTEALQLALDVWPSNYSFGTVERDPSQILHQVVSVWNNSNAEISAISWNSSMSGTLAPFATMDITSGDFAAWGDQADIDVAIDTTGITEGDYTLEIKFFADGCADVFSTLTLTISVTYIGQLTCTFTRIAAPFDVYTQTVDLSDPADVGWLRNWSFNFPEISQDVRIGYSITYLLPKGWAIKGTWVKYQGVEVFTFTPGTNAPNGSGVITYYNDFTISWGPP